MKVREISPECVYLWVIFSLVVPVVAMDELAEVGSVSDKTGGEKSQLAEFEKLCEPWVLDLPIKLMNQYLGWPISN